MIIFWRIDVPRAAATALAVVGRTGRRAFAPRAHQSESLVLMTVVALQ
jgi:hypothetical protein